MQPVQRGPHWRSCHLFTLSDTLRIAGRNHYVVTHLCSFATWQQYPIQSRGEFQRKWRSGKVQQGEQAPLALCGTVATHQRERPPVRLARVLTFLFTRRKVNFEKQY